MPAPEILAHHPFTRSEEVEGGSQPCGRDLLLGRRAQRITPAAPGQLTGTDEEIRRIVAKE
jgi:hypothetical protein